MSAEQRNRTMTSAEWMKYYEKLFHEKNPVKGSPARLDREETFIAGKEDKAAQKPLR